MKYAYVPESRRKKMENIKVLTTSIHEKGHKIQGQIKIDLVDTTEKIREKPLIVTTLFPIFL